MSLIQSGKTFNDGEQLTAAKLNQMFADSTLSTTGVDGTSIIINANDVLAVRSINGARIDANAVTFNKIQEIPTNTVLGRTTTATGIVEEVTVNTDDAMANASATTLATDGSIKAYVNSIITNADRRKFVALTGGTTTLTKTNQADGTTVTYNIADFTSDDSSFDASKITGVVVEAKVENIGSIASENNISVSLPDGTSTLITRAYAEPVQIFTYTAAPKAKSCETFTVPINETQTSFSITYSVGNNNALITTYNETIIKGAIIN